MLWEFNKLTIIYLDFWEGEMLPSSELGAWRVRKLLITVRTKIHGVLIWKNKPKGQSDLSLSLSLSPASLSFSLSPLLSPTSCLLRCAWHLNRRLSTLTTPSILSALISTCHSVALFSGDSTLSAIPHTRCTHLYGKPYCRTADENTSPPLFLIW